MTPFGPVHWGVSWLGYMLLAMVVMLLLGVLLPPQKPPQKAEGKAVTDYELFEKNAAAYPIGISIGMFFWVMIVALLIIAGFRIYYQTM
jgi:hypothetical protein